MLRAEGQYNCIVSSRRLEFEIERAAEPFAQRQAPGAVDSNSERRVDHELHPSRLIEEPFEDERLLRGDDAKRLIGRNEILRELLGRWFRNAGLSDQLLSELILPI